MQNNRNQSKRPRQGSARQQTTSALNDELLRRINLANPDAELFDTTAEEVAQKVSDSRNSENKPTQLRRFYDEVCVWDMKIKQKPEDFEKYLPFIRMLNAKVAYAEGRKLVDGQFNSLIRDCLRKVNDIQTFNNFKLFFEAFLGFYKALKKD